ncbi:MAG: hypothetical protein JNM85_04510 [Chthonomonas sp.]|nr:hypothetical protein [Chthonomonas sp.]
MSHDDLSSLLRLHKVDAAIVELKKRAANMDAGRSVKEEIERLKPKWSAATTAYASSRTEVADLELLQKTLTDKIQHIESLLYSGKVVNPREVEAYQKEQKMFQRQRDEAETKALELLEAQPPLRKEATIIDRAMQELQAKQKAQYDAAVAEKERMQAQYKTLVEKRKTIAPTVPAGLLKQYEAIRERHGGIGMSEVTATGNCAQCGTSLPTKPLEYTKEGRIVTCEACHRILIRILVEG